MLSESDRLPCALAPRTGDHECSDGDDNAQVGDTADGGAVHGGVYIYWERRE